VPDWQVPLEEHVSEPLQKFSSAQLESARQSTHESSASEQKLRQEGAVPD